MYRVLVSLVGATMLVFAAPAWTSEVSAAKEEATLLLGTTKSEDNVRGIFERRVYTEALSRLNLKVKFIQMSLRRLDAALASGDIDIEAPREWDYVDQIPGVVRVDEPIFSISFAIYTANPALPEQRIEAFSRDLNVEFRRGIDDCKVPLTALFPKGKVSDIVSTEQGLRKLVNRRTDLYCDVDHAVEYLLRRTKTSEFSSIRKVSDLGPPNSLYTYVSKKNALLAPRLDKVLKQMKAEGLLDRFMAQAKKEVSELNRH